MIDLAYVSLGIALLAAGGELLIRAALAAAHRLHVSPLLSGLVIVGFGTSMPELVVSADAALSSQPQIAVGNVVGSNIGNVLLILGVCALITPLQVRPLALRRDAIVAVGASVLFVLLATTQQLTRLDALVLLSAFVAYLVWAYRSERSQTAPPAQMHIDEAAEVTPLPQSGILIPAGLIAGLTLMIGGSYTLIEGAVGLAQNLGVPDTVIGITIVAVGTSMPELSISVIAAWRRHADVAIGNILGSNIFNILAILGISALITPLTVDARIVAVDQWVMLGAALALLLFLYTDRRLTRSEGAALLAAYVAYVVCAFVFPGQ